MAHYLVAGAVECYAPSLMDLVSITTKVSLQVLQDHQPGTFLHLLGHLLNHNLDDRLGTLPLLADHHDGNGLTAQRGFDLIAFVDLWLCAITCNLLPFIMPPCTVSLVWWTASVQKP